jgi:phenylpropionate dioxygenase-like ring-hydroxylating dioxygenase large terminal subunit
VTLDKEAPDLAAYLAHARPYIDSFFAEGRMTVSGHMRLAYDGNWKLQMENVVDNYHLGFLHQSWLDIVRDRYDTKASNWRTDGLRSWSLSNGHAAIDFHEKGAAASPGQTGGITPFNLIVFPNLALAADHTIMIVTPLEHDRTSIDVTHLVPADADEGERAVRIRRHEDFYGPFGFVVPDDLEVAFRRVTEGVKATRGDRRVWFNRGMARETWLDDGRCCAPVMDELPQRGFYRQWLELMTCDREAVHGLRIP